MQKAKGRITEGRETNEYSFYTYNAKYPSPRNRDAELQSRQQK